MHNDMTEAERQILIAYIELSEPLDTPNNTHYSTHPTTLEEALAYFLGFNERWEEAYDSLHDLGLLVKDQSGREQLTLEGREEARRQRLEHPPIWYWYREYYRFTARSTVYSHFCEQLYGKNLCQTNFSDVKQVDFLIKEAGLQPGMRALDLGCGNGIFAEYLSDSTGALVDGLDYVLEAIEQAQERTRAKRGRLNFFSGNLDQLECVFGQYDLITSVDTLYMPKDLPATLRAMHHLLAPGGIMLIYFTELLFDTIQSRDILTPVGTGLGKALTACKLPYITWDFSEATFRLMQNKRKLAENMREEFEKEGTLFLYTHLVSESFGGEEKYSPETANICRYLYRVES